MGHRLLPGRPQLYHGKETSRPYFEGWYFKQTSNQSLCIIPGVYRGYKHDDDIAFIQFITQSGQSFFFNYPYDSFHFNKNKFEIWIDKSFFSMDKLLLNIKQQDIQIEGELFFNGMTLLQTGIFSPSIMGPFSYMPHMQCNHGVLSIKHKVNGSICCQDKVYSFNNACGYIEKDWGEAFPSHWIWMQCNDCDSSVMFSIANIPFGPMSFTGHICVLLFNKKQYRFATYNNSKVSITKKSDTVSAQVERGKYKLNISATGKDFGVLKAPTKTGMNRDIDECVNAEYSVTLLKQGKKIFSKTYSNGGLEMLEPDKLVNHIE